MLFIVRTYVHRHTHTNAKGQLQKPTHSKWYDFNESVSIPSHVNIFHKEMIITSSTNMNVKSCRHRQMRIFHGKIILHVDHPMMLAMCIALADAIPYADIKKPSLCDEVVVPCGGCIWSER